jgi:hypothetical protein
MKKRNWNWTKPVVVTADGVDDKDGCLHPEKVDGKYCSGQIVYLNYKSNDYIFTGDWGKIVLNSNGSNGSNRSNQTKINGSFDKKRHTQDKFWFHETLKELILNQFFNDTKIGEKIDKLESKIIEGKISSFQAAEELFKQYLNNQNGTSI